MVDRKKSKRASDRLDVVERKLKRISKALMELGLLDERGLSKGSHAGKTARAQDRWGLNQADGEYPQSKAPRAQLQR